MDCFFTNLQGIVIQTRDNGDTNVLKYVFFGNICKCGGIHRLTFGKVVESLKKDIRIGVEVCSAMLQGVNEFVETVCHLELSMIQKCKMIPECDSGSQYNLVGVLKDMVNELAINKTVHGEQLVFDKSITFGVQFESSLKERVNQSLMEALWNGLIEFMRVFRDEMVARTFGNWKP